MSVDTPNGPVVMVYSGEAYNFSELREELYGRGHRFRTDSDTEVADVPSCTLLSGGLDSSALTTIAAQQLAEAGKTLRSFAVDFVGQTENFVADGLRGTPDALTCTSRATAPRAGADAGPRAVDGHVLADRPTRRHWCEWSPGRPRTGRRQRV